VRKHETWSNSKNLAFSFHLFSYFFIHGNSTDDEFIGNNVNDDGGTDNDHCNVVPIMSGNNIKLCRR